MSDEKWPMPIEPPDMLKELAEGVGGKIDECALLPDGSGFATMTMPLPKDHWLTVEGHNEPPEPFKMAWDEHVVIAIFPNMGYPHRHLRITRREFADKIMEAAKYAVRASTYNGKEIDFDPDAMIRNFVNGLLGYDSGGLVAAQQGTPTQDAPEGTNEPATTV